MPAALRRLRRVPRALALAAIRVYKRLLSPHKGFSCAYRLHTGRASCSTLGYRAVARYGVFRGLGILDARLDQCRLAHERLVALSPPRRGRPAFVGQAGFVDCDGCDAPCDVSCADGFSWDIPGCDACAGASGGPVDAACEALECINCADACDCFDVEPCGGWRRRRRGRPARGEWRGPHPEARPPTSEQERGARGC